MSVQETSFETIARARNRRRTRRRNQPRMRKYESIGSLSQDIDDKNCEVAFLPNQIRQLLSQSPAKASSPSCEVQYGVVLFVDISGFTALGKSLRANNPENEATEKLAAQIMEALTFLTDVCIKWGGDVSKFAGDALLCTWNISEDTESYNYLSGREKREALEASMKFARSAASEMLKGIKTINPELDLHGGIGKGSIMQFNLVQRIKGEPASRWHLLSGYASKEAGTLLDESARGSILFTLEKGSPLNDKDVKVTREITASTDTDCAEEIDFFMAARGLRPSIAVTDWADRLDRDLVVSYIPYMLRDKMRGGGIVGGEIVSSVSIMFVALDSLLLSDEELKKTRVNALTLKKLNKVFSILSKTVRDAGGEIRDLLFDDKGCTFIGVFGAHELAEKTELKSVFCAKKIMKVMSNSVRIGVSSGACFTGMCGNSSRHDFVVMGHEVNQAARYCSGATKGQILVSPQIFKKTKKFMEYEAFQFERTKNLTTVLPSGEVVPTGSKTETFSCFIAGKETVLEPSDRTKYSGNSMVGDGTGNAEHFVGRTSEIEKVTKFLYDSPLGKLPKPKGSGDVVCIKGDPGIGKSSFIRRLMGILEPNCDVAYCAGFEVEQSSPLFVLKQVVLNLVDSDDATVAEKGLERVLTERCKALNVSLKDIVLRVLTGGGLAEARSNLKASFRESSFLSVFSPSPPRKSAQTRLKTTSSPLPDSSGNPRHSTHRTIKSKSPEGGKKKRQAKKLYSGGSSSKFPKGSRTSRDVRLETDSFLDHMPATRKNSIAPGKLGARVALENELRNRSFSLVDWEKGEVENVLDVLTDDEISALDEFLRDLISVSVRKSTKKSLVIIIEDLHWVDHNSLGQLYELISKPIKGVTYILSHRSKDYSSHNQESTDDFEQDLKRMASARKTKNVHNKGRFLFVALRPMTSADCSSLVVALLLQLLPPPSETSSKISSPRKLISQKVVSILYRKTNGKPNYVLLLVKYYVDNDFIKWADDDKKYEFKPSMGERAMDLLPKSIAEIAGYRLNVLDGMQKRILKAAACIGKQFTTKELWLVLDRDGVAFSEKEMTGALHIICKTGFISTPKNKRRSVLRRPEKSKSASARRLKSFRLGQRSTATIANSSSGIAPPEQSIEEVWLFAGEIYHKAVLNLIPNSRQEEIQGFLCDLEEAEELASIPPVKKLSKKANRQRPRTFGPGFFQKSGRKATLD